MSDRHSNSSNHVTLYVKTGSDGFSYGACPACQRIYMILELKARGGSLTYDIHNVNMSKPTLEFKKFSNRLPVLIHEDEVVIDSDDIVHYVDNTFLLPDLRYNDREADKVCLHIFSKFSFYLKNVSHSHQGLLKELVLIDRFLQCSGNRFLCGDHVTHLDCLMLPKFQHIRIALVAFKGFHIPVNLSHFWRYMKEAYTTDIFRLTCPSDQEIVDNWAAKIETTPLTDAKLKEHIIDTWPTFSAKTSGLSKK